MRVIYLLFYFLFSATPRIQWGSCGLSGEMRVNFTVGDPKGCDGTLTDWNPRACSAKSKLMVWSDQCRVYYKDGKWSRNMNIIM